MIIRGSVTLWHAVFWGIVGAILAAAIVTQGVGCTKAQLNRIDPPASIAPDGGWAPDDDNPPCSSNDGVGCGTDLPPNLMNHHAPYPPAGTGR